jgi:hypothetical protein
VHFMGKMNLSKYNTKSNRLHMTLVSILVQGLNLIIHSTVHWTNIPRVSGRK